MNQLYKTSTFLLALVLLASCFQSTLVFDNPEALDDLQQDSLILGHWELISEDQSRENFIFMPKGQGYSYSLESSNEEPLIHEINYQFSSSRKNLQIRVSKADKKLITNSYSLHSISNHLLKLNAPNNEIDIFKRKAPLNLEYILQGWFAIENNNNYGANSYQFKSNKKGIEECVQPNSKNKYHPIQYDIDENYSLLYINNDSYSSQYKVKQEFAIILNLKPTYMNILTPYSVVKYLAK